MNVIFVGLIGIAFLSAGWRQWHWTGTGLAPMAELSSSITTTAASAVELALGLVGVMAFFLGLMKIAEEGGLLKIIARVLHPLTRRLFPEVPPQHPAMGFMVLNLSSNLLGLGNAATPFGIRAMQELQKINTHPGVASNAMVLFLAINTSGITLLPTGVIALRAAAGSSDPAGIIGTTLFATLCSTLVAILVAFGLRSWFPLSPVAAPVAPVGELSDQSTPDSVGEPYSLWISLGVLVGLIGLMVLSVFLGPQLGVWMLPTLVMGFLLFGVARGVKTYEVFVDGAKEGFQVALKIIPYLVAILVAVGMLRASGALALFVDWAGSYTAQLGLPAEALPMALLRPLSGSGAYGVMAAVLNDPAIGPDSYIGYLVSTIQGSTETTFYVLAVYFGAVQIRRTRHALWAGLSADVAGLVGSIVAVRYVLGI